MVAITKYQKILKYINNSERNLKLLYYPQYTYLNKFTATFLKNKIRDLHFLGVKNFLQQTRGI